MAERKITALRQQKRNQERVNVYLDGEFAFGLPLESAIGLRVGQTLSDAEIAALQDQDQFVRLRSQAERYLSYRPRSTAELRRHLLRKGHDEAQVERVIAYLTERSLLDDYAFARYWVEQRVTFKPRSQMALRQELYARGVDAAAIDAARGSTMPPLPMTQPASRPEVAGTAYDDSGRWRLPAASWI